jgi:hypothetical protein
MDQWICAKEHEHNRKEWPSIEPVFIRIVKTPLQLQKTLKKTSLSLGII